MVCGPENSTNSQYEDSDASFSRTPKSLRSKLTKLCLRFLALLFGVLVVISVAIAVALIITQKPVDLSQGGDLAQSFSHYSRHGDHPRRLPADNYSQLTIEGLLMGSGTVRPDYFSLWLANDDLIMMDHSSNFILINTADLSQPPRIFIKRDQFKPDHKGRNVLFNSNAEYVALFKGLSQVYRHSHRAIYEVAKLENGQLRSYYPIGPQSTGNEALQLFEWNPAMGAKDFVFVYENNIYYQSEPEDGEAAFPITNTGNNFKYHGVSDWLYEEEIFSTSKAVWWSPSGRFLAYASFDDRNVTRVRVPHYDPRNVYATYDDVPYPKAGTDRQPLVFLWIWDKEHNATQMVLPPDELFLASEDSKAHAGKSAYYLYSAQWIIMRYEGEQENIEYLVAVWANRQQNEVYISTCRYKYTCTQHHHVSFTLSGRKMWSEPSDFIIEFYSKNGYFVLLPREYTDGNIYNHVAHVHLQVGQQSDGLLISFHGGPYDVKQIVGYDAERDDIYFLSAGGTIGQMHVFRVPLAASTANGEPQCVTCVMEACSSSRVKFAPSGKQFVLNCHFPYRHSRAFLKKTDDVLTDNILRDDIQLSLGFDPPKISHEKIQTDSGIDAHVGMILPPKFDASYNYPVLLYTYAGPNSNLNQMETPWDFMTYFANRRQYIIVMIDGRGSAQRGWNIKEPLYMNLGGPEVDDQIEVMRKLLSRYSFLDSERVAVFGWSYGGFVSSHIAARDVGKTFKCAISVAPVVDFRFYDSAYTERYMRLPQENAVGYEKTNLLSNLLVSNIRHVKFMLAHGDADDNVHYQNSALLASALQERGIHFKQLVYTNQDHTIRSVIGHLYMEVDRFLLQDCYNFTTNY